MIDLGCHPMYLSSLFLGMPESVTASYGYVTGREVEDNAVVTLNYANGSIGIAESSFVNRFSPFTIEIHGTEGSLFYGGPEGHLLIRSSRLSDGGQDWQDWTTRIPQDLPLAFSQWVKHIQQETIALTVRIAEIPAPTGAEGERAPDSLPVHEGSVPR